MIKGDINILQKKKNHCSKQSFIENRENNRKRTVY